jgi:hypothetical protein
MPVLPLVGSTSVSPGSTTPSASARSIMNFAGRSLAEPPGLNDSTLAATVAPSGARTDTSGDPMASTIESCNVSCIAAGYAVVA